MTVATFGGRSGADGVTEDSWLLSSLPTTNFPAQDDSGQVEFIIRFPGLTGIGPGVTVSAATLTLYVTSGGSSDNVAVRRLLRAWVETQATWNIFSTGNNWGTAGALNTTTDISATESCQIDYTGGFATGDFVSINNTTLIADVEAMMNGDLANNGWRVDAANPAFGLPNIATAAQRPLLTVTYEVGGAASILPLVACDMANIDGMRNMRG